ncbi:hypothetical protein RCL1_005309 [Eukaryota sp. TZLM3-RCL]
MPNNTRKRRLPLADQITNDRVIVKPKKKARQSKDLFESDSEDSSNETETLTASTTQKLIAVAQSQAKDESASLNEMPDDETVEPYDNLDVDADDANTEEEVSEYELEVDAEDENALNAFFGSETNIDFDNGTLSTTRNLSDMILAKIHEHEAQASTENEKFEPKVVEVFKGLNTFMRSYKSGKVPKALKMLPALKNWDEILDLADPFTWSRNGIERLTRVMVANLKPKPLQRYFENFLLPIIRNDVSENKKMNYHLYQALKKCVYKPSAFYKGLIFPLLESGSVSNREAIIVGSVLKKVSIPAVHSSVAIIKMTEMDWHPPVSFFIKVLLDKKYNLPLTVVNVVVAWLAKFLDYRGSLPVVWNQAFLVFVQRYRRDINMEDKQVLLKLNQTKSHPSFVSLIRNELSVIDASVSNLLI